MYGHCSQHAPGRLSRPVAAFTLQALHLEPLRLKPCIESSDDTSLGVHEAKTQTGIGCRVHSLWPRRKGAEGSVRRSLTRDARMKATCPDDGVGILVPMLDSVAEPVSFTREKPLAALR